MSEPGCWRSGFWSTVPWMKLQISDLTPLHAVTGSVHSVGLVHLPGGLRQARLQVPAGQPPHGSGPPGEVSNPSFVARMNLVVWLHLTFRSIISKRTSFTLISRVNRILWVVSILPVAESSLNGESLEFLPDRRANGSFESNRAQSWALRSALSSAPTSL